jgi:dipeptidyl aminopeptidase/acylaminoacyl peptidase
MAVCVSGVSSGGQLALLLAAHRRVTCTIAQAAPTDLATLHGWVRDAAAKYLLPYGSVRRWSPVSYASRIRGPVLLATPKHDPAVAADQSRRMAQRLPGSRLVVLANATPGLPFGHTTVSPPALRHYRDVERAFALRAISPKRRRN